MATAPKNRTAELNGRLWGSRAQDWADVQERTILPVYEAVLQRSGVGAHTNYLDAGCGSGLAVQLAAQRGARVSGIDAAENLLAIARARVPFGHFAAADLEELPFPDHTFDVVTGFNSFQYAANPDVALSEARRVARTGSIVVIVTWSEPEGMEAAAFVGALRLLAPPPPVATPGPFSLSNDHALREFAYKAGLMPEHVLDVNSPWRYPDLSTALRGLMSTGNAIRVAELTSQEEVKKAYADVLERFRRTDGTYRIDATFRCMFARA